MGQRGQIDFAQHVQTRFGRRSRCVGRIGIPGKAVGLCVSQRYQRDTLLVGVLFAHAGVVGGDFLSVTGRLLG